MYSKVLLSELVIEAYWLAHVEYNDHLKCIYELSISPRYRVGWLECIYLGFTFMRLNPNVVFGAHARSTLVLSPL